VAVARVPEFTVTAWTRRRRREFSHADLGSQADVEPHQSTGAYMARGLQAAHDRSEALLPSTRKVLDFFPGRSRLAVPTQHE